MSILIPRINVFINYSHVANMVCVLVAIGFYFNVVVN